MKQKSSAAKLALVVALSSTLSVTAVQAGIPVIDATNLSQNIMTAIESVAQTLKQIEQYQTQLQQYENQLQNTMAPAAYIWDQAQSTINGLMNAVDTLNYYKTQLGSLDNYLAKFQDVSYYRSAACFSRDGCTAAQRAALEANCCTAAMTSCACAALPPRSMLSASVAASFLELASSMVTRSPRMDEKNPTPAPGSMP